VTVLFKSSLTVHRAPTSTLVTSLLSFPLPLSSVLVLAHLLCSSHPAVRSLPVLVQQGETDEITVSVVLLLSQGKVLGVCIQRVMLQRSLQLPM
jgi:hypothetical protein